MSRSGRKPLSAHSVQGPLNFKVLQAASGDCRVNIVVPTIMFVATNPSSVLGAPMIPPYTLLNIIPFTPTPWLQWDEVFLDIICVQLTTSYPYINS